jgi:hypothetical protein
MRKLLALLVLLPFAAVAVLSCDDSPTAPEEASAATTIQESSTPQASRQPPALPMPVVLSAVELVFGTPAVAYEPGDFAESFAQCPMGKAPLTCGYSTSLSGGSTFLVAFQGPTATMGEPPLGCSVKLKLTYGDGVSGFATALCADATYATD